MDLLPTAVLGLVAGATIVLGLPVARLSRVPGGVRVGLNAGAAGILLFLLWDVLRAAWEPIDSSLAEFGSGAAGFAPIVGYGSLFVTGLALGLLGLVGYERWVSRKRPQRIQGSMRRAALVTSGSDGSRLESPTPHTESPTESPLTPRRLAMLIAVGIGVHNLAEGLAIGQSAASGDLALATVLVIGFALHNATEGFGIAAPLAGDRDEDGRHRTAPWSLLFTYALIAGGPTFVGTMIGHQVDGTAASVSFLALAAGSILYVVMALLALAARAGRPTLVAWCLLSGLLAGFATDGILVIAGA